MTTDTIRQAARCGFQAYYYGRPGYVWEPKWFPIWELVAAHVLNDPGYKPWDCHTLYNATALDPVPWSAISTKTRDKWHMAFRAMKRVGDAAYAERSAA
jgi:hypothetical protein